MVSRNSIERIKVIFVAKLAIIESGSPEKLYILRFGFCYVNIFTYVPISYWYINYQTTSSLTKINDFLYYSFRDPHPYPTFHDPTRLPNPHDLVYLTTLIKLNFILTYPPKNEIYAYQIGFYTEIFPYSIVVFWR